ncbi:MAG: tetratricopeptide repeat protein [Myxococcales bacterium]|nr:tetratricopeptide repeat protein [Myxococcales bacterium]
MIIPLAACTGREPPPAAPAPAPGATPPPADPAAANTTCEDCHPEEAARFRATGMGRSLAPVADAPAIERFDAATVDHPTSGFRYRALRDAEGRLWQEEQLLADPTRVRRIEARWILGSGNHARTYLGLLDGSLVELPLTWYSRRGAWDLSPGYDRPDQWRLERPITPPCLFCHNGLTPALPGTQAGYALPLAAGIGCDRCHGDGTAHAAARQAGTGPAPGAPDPSIFNPGREPADRQLQVCQQCHLQGEVAVLHAGQRWDRYDPRAPLASFVAQFRRGGSARFTVASHGHRLRLSACAQDPRLTCTTCHNPHEDATPATHRAACLSCHTATRPCPDPAAATESCAGCHMAAGGPADVPHVRFTDHFIRRRPTADADPGAGVPTTALVDLVAGADEGGPGGRLRAALAQSQLWLQKRLADHLPIAQAALEAVIAAGPQPDLGSAHAALGRIYAFQGRHAEALAAFARVGTPGFEDAARLPDDVAASQVALGRLPAALATLEAADRQQPTVARQVERGRLLRRLGRLPEARAVLEKVIESTTYDPSALAELAGVAFQQGDAAEASRHVAAALARDGAYPPALLVAAQLELRAGRPGAARPLLDVLVQRDPRAQPAFGLRAQVHEALGQPAAALADYEQASRLGPTPPDVALSAARLALTLGRRDVARGLLDAALARSPGDARLRALRDEVR